jgi:hypothetical protein
MYGHRLAVILTTLSREHYPTLCGMACRANESMVLDAWDSVPDINSAPHALHLIARTPTELPTSG